MSTCPDYTEYAKVFHGEASQGILGLPFQRPIEACRTFTSKAIDYVVESVASKIVNSDLARLFTNTFPNTLDTTIYQTSCLIPKGSCDHPLTFVITGDIDAMWLRDSANQLMPYLPFANQDVSLKRLLLGTLYMQAQFISIDPYANAFRAPDRLDQWAQTPTPPALNHQPHSPGSTPQVYEFKWEIDSLASFFSLSYQYWQHTNDSSFVDSPIWFTAVERILDTLQQEQQGTFDSITGQVNPVNEEFHQQTDRPTETQFQDGRGQPIRRTGMIRTLFRPSDDACVYPFFVPGNAMMAVELDHLSQLIKERNATMAQQAQSMSKEIRDAIYKYAVVDVPDHGKVFAYEVDGYGSQLIMDDANIPSLLSLPLLGFIDQADPIYQNTRRLVLSRANPYYFEGPRMVGIGGPHVPLNYAWPMSQIVRILTSTDDEEIKQTLQWLVNSTDKTGLIHESVSVFNVKGGKDPYTRSWFAWANGLFGQAILKISQEKPHLLSV
ncbi:meiotically up-regulated gene 157 protein [Chlamydoabsidia padenii]|nr:meiotically up-regulated gene 157 protein [Chlamydoabsidia padenii]